VDGKNFLLLTNKKYDIIINDVVHPAFAGNAAFYSHEYFQMCRKKLKPDGIMTSVIPLFKISIEDFKVLINTFRSVFPFTTLWYNNNYLNHYAFLLGSVDPEFKIDYRQISNKLNDPAIIINLTQIGMDNIYEILDCFIMGPKIIKELTEGVRLNRDNLPHLEFSTPKTADTPSNWNQTLQLMANYRESVFPYLSNIDSTLEQREFVRLILDNYYQSTELVFNALSCELMGKPDKALQIYRQVYMMNRFDRSAKRFLDSYYDSLLIASPQNPAEFIQNASVYYQKMEYEEAVNLVNKALELNPDYAPAYFALGINYEIMGDLKKAKEMYQKTLKVKPNLQQAKDRLDSLALKNSN
jgi:tetratricopeptide (TPR) repeat protein